MVKSLTNLERKIVLRAVIFTALAALSAITPAWAETDFDLSNIDNIKSNLVIKENRANVRQTPNPQGTVVGKLSLNDIVEGLGRVKNAPWWLIAKDGAPYGYVYQNSLLPLFDASLSDPLNGKLDLTQNKRGKCDYTITPLGRSKEEEIVFISFDYGVHFDCHFKGTKFQFDAMMFMSEVPLEPGRAPVYQINLDITEIATGYEEFLSASVLFEKSKKRVKPDGVSLKDFQTKAEIPPKEAKKIDEILRAALEIQMASFNVKAWNVMAGLTANPGALKPGN